MDDFSEARKAFEKEKVDPKIDEDLELARHRLYIKDLKFR